MCPKNHLVVFCVLGLALCPSAKAMVVKTIEQGDSRLWVEVDSATDPVSWREQLARHFNIRPTLSLWEAITPGEDNHQRVALHDVLPYWMTALAMRRSPGLSNCVTTSLFLAGYLPDPFGLHASHRWFLGPGVPFVSEWIKQGMAESIPYSPIEWLRLGDVISATSESGMISASHVYFYLGESYAFEHNSRDFFQTYLFSRLDSDWMPIHAGPQGEYKPYLVQPSSPPVVFRPRIRPDFGSELEIWTKNEPKLFSVYQEIRRELRSAWFQSVLLTRPSPDRIAEIKSTYRTCDREWDQIRDGTISYRSPDGDFYAICRNTIRSYDGYFKYRDGIGLL